MRKKKRFLALAAALCLAVSLAVPAGAAGADTQLETIRVMGILTGDGSGSLNLGSPVTRAEFVKMMAAASPYKDSVGSGYGAALFSDVKGSYWASGYIRLAVEQGWVTGYVDGSFRPTRTITLEEGVTALLRLLGYDSASLTGSFPEAQLTKGQALGLMDGLSVARGQTLTRQDCVTLFYNTLTAKTAAGAVYAQTLGYTVSNGEVDYASLVTVDTKGPYVAPAAGSVTVPFSTGSMTVYRNGSLSSLSAVKEYDVYYYNANLRTVWVYSDRVTGTLTAVSPNRAAPTAVTVAGNSYSIGSSTAAYQLSSQGSFALGDAVTLLLDRDGAVAQVISAAADSAVYYGVVVSSEKAASNDATSTGSAAVQTVTRLACTDGTERTFYHSGSALTVGRAACASSTAQGSTVSVLSGASLSGRFSADGTTFAGYTLASDVEILDTTEDGQYVRVYPARLAGVSLSSSDVRYYVTDSQGKLSRLILNNVTGDMLSYAYVTSAVTSSGDGTSGTYRYMQSGQSHTVSGGAVYSAREGGAVLYYKNGALSSIRQLASVDLTQLGSLTAAAGNTTYKLDENVQVLLREYNGSGNYYAAALSDIDAGSYTLTGWYDQLGCAAGGRIRVIVATPK